MLTIEHVLQLYKFHVSINEFVVNEIKFDDMAVVLIYTIRNLVSVLSYQ